MRISTKLRVIAVAPIIVFIILGALLFTQFQKTEKLHKAEAACDEISGMTSDLVILTYEYSMTLTDRPRIQWNIQHSAMLKQLKTNAGLFEHPQEKRIFDEINSTYETLGRLFAEYVEYSKNISSRDISVLHSELRINMLNRLILELQAIHPKASRLNDIIYGAANRSASYQAVIVMVMVISLVIFITPVSLLIISNISRMLNAIHSGMKIAASGDLKYRIAMKSNDEIGLLAKGFDEMTDKLDSTIVTRDKLLNEIEERKRAEKALEQAAMEWSAAMDASDDVICLLDTDLNLIRGNRAFYMMTASTQETAAGSSILGLLHPAGEPEVCPVCVALNDLRDAAVIMEGDDPANPSGHAVEATVRVVRDNLNNPASILVNLHDLTRDRKVQEDKSRLESQLYQAQKMEAVGHLAGGIAHDFNNMLTAIIGYGNLIEMKLEKESLLRPYVAQILSSAEKSANLTRQLLAFSRKQIIAPKETELNELISGMEKLLIRLIGEDIELKTELIGRDIFVMVDPGQIEQVIMNLCTNARDAMPEGGMLSIGTGIVELDKAYADAHELQKAGLYAVMSVTDTGKGMDQKTLQRIFEPFFTTKEVNKGTGLGLSIVYGVVKQHNGNITVYSEPGRGTTFKVYLPVIQGVEGKKTTDVAVVPKGGTETILIAEDNEDVRVLTKQLLENAGYTVVVASDGEDALSRFRESGGGIDLVILDVIMPRMSGKETADEIRKQSPDSAILFTSGYTADIIGKKGILEKGVEFISKPVTPNDLLLKIRGLLDSRKNVS